MNQRQLEAIAQLASQLRNALDVSIRQGRNNGENNALVAASMPAIITIVLEGRA